MDKAEMNSFRDIGRHTTCSSGGNWPKHPIVWPNTYWGRCCLMEILRWSCRHSLISDNIGIGASETIAHFCSHGGRPPDSTSQLIGPLWLSTWNRYSTAWRKSATFTCLVCSSG